MEIRNHLRVSYHITNFEKALKFNSLGISHKLDYFYRQNRGEYKKKYEENIAGLVQLPCLLFCSETKQHLVFLVASPLEKKI